MDGMPMLMKIAIALAVLIAAADLVVAAARRREQDLGPR